MKNFFTKNIVKNCLILFSSKGITTLIGLFSSILYGIVFNKSDIAIIVLFEMFVQLAVSIGFNWSAVGVIRFGKEEIEQKGTLNHVTGVRAQLFLPLIIIFLIGLTLFHKNIQSYIGLNGNLTIFLLLINIVFLIVHDHFTQIFTTLEKHKINAVYFIFVSLIKIVVFASFVFHLLNLNIVTYLSVNILGLFVLLLWRLTLVKKEYFLPMFRIFDREEYIQFIKFVAPQFLGFIGLFLINWIDTIVIKKYCSLDNLGAYNYMYSLFMKVAMGAFIINTVFFPRILTWKNSNEIKRIHAYIRKVPIPIFGGILLFSIVMSFLFPSFFDMIYGEKFHVAYSSFTLMLYVLPFYFLSYVMVPIVNAYDKVMILQILNIVSAGVNLLADFILIPSIGIIGGAVGTMLCYGVKCLGLACIVYNLKKKVLI